MSLKSMDAFLVALSDKNVQKGITGLEKSTDNIKKGAQLGAYVQLNDLMQSIIGTSPFMAPFETFLTLLKADTVQSNASAMSELFTLLTSEETLSNFSSLTTMVNDNNTNLATFVGYLNDINSNTELINEKFPQLTAGFQTFQGILTGLTPKFENFASVFAENFAELPEIALAVANESISFWQGAALVALKAIDDLIGILGINSKKIDDAIAKLESQMNQVADAVDITDLDGGRYGGFQQ